jgi:phosphatidylserine/phosphatidylglycerophosphate/cardiolipin synthase-like enzyme
MIDRHTVKRWVTSITRPANLVSSFFLVVLTVLFLNFYRSVAPSSTNQDIDLERGVGEIEVFFSAPDNPLSKTLRGGPDAQLAESILGARRSVDLAAYNLDLWSVRDALLQAHDSGVIVRVVVEGSNFEEAEIQDLVRAGIEVAPDTSEDLMHHKFVVIDQWDVWTGSMNFTINGAYRNDNNLLHLQSGSLANDYRREFEEMFLDGRFGRLSKRDTPYPELSIGPASVEVYFSPEDGALSGLIRALQQAREQVLVMAFTLTADEIAELLIQRAEEGLDVRVIFEAGQIRSVGTDYERLLESSVDVRTDRNPYNMHHKVIIIDGEVVITGSYNFTRSAEERNDENLIIIMDESLANAYLVEFTRIWEAAQ